MGNSPLVSGLKSTSHWPYCVRDSSLDEGLVNISRRNWHRLPTQLPGGKHALSLYPLVIFVSLLHRRITEFEHCELCFIIIICLFVCLYLDPNTKRFKRTLIYFNTDTQYANFRGNPLYQASKRHLNNR